MSPGLLRRIVARFKNASIQKLDLSLIEKLRKDFLILLKNLPRVKDYKTACELNRAFLVYQKNFETLFFDNYLNQLQNVFRDKTLVKDVNDKLRVPAYQFYNELQLPIDEDYSGTYQRSEESRFRDYEEKIPKWKARVQNKARIFWNAVKDFIEDYKNQEEITQVNIPDIDRTQLEGFQFIIKGYDANSKYDPMVLDRVKEGLRIYRRRALSVMPILLQKQIPIMLDYFEFSLDVAGRYISTEKIIKLYAIPIIKSNPQRIVQVLAHEMGHHIYRNILDGNAQDFWSAAIKSDYGDIDIQEILDAWPGNVWSYDFPEKMKEKDPILALQVDALNWNPQYSDKLNRKEDYQKLLDEGIKTLQVPKTPISGYANKNTEEAFCEVIGLLVAFGPRTVHERVRGWFNIIFPDQVKLSSLSPHHSVAIKV